MLRYLDNPEGKSNPSQEQEPDVEVSEIEEVSTISEDDVAEPVSDLAEDMESLDEEHLQGSQEDEQVTLLKQKNRDLEQRISYLERVVKVSQILNSTLSLEPLLQIIIQAATELTATEACSIMLIDKATGELLNP